MNFCFTFKTVFFIFFCCFLVACQQTSDLETTPIPEATASDLQRTMATMPEYNKYIELIGQRFDQINSQISLLSPAEKLVLGSIRSKFTQTSDTDLRTLVTNIENQDLKTFSALIPANPSLSNNITATLESIENKLHQKYRFNSQTFLLALKGNSKAARTTEVDCYAKASDVYHATYYIARWESGQTADQARDVATLVSDSFLAGCLFAEGN